MFNSLVLSIDSFAIETSKKTFFTNTLGLARSLLALGTLLTLLLNNINVLFPLKYYANFSSDAWFSKINIFHSLGYDNLWISKAICIAILLFVISGYFPRITGILHWWVAYSFHVGATVVDGGDQVSSNIALMLIPLTLIDKRRNHWSCQELSYSSVSSIVAYTAVIAIQIQVAIIYLFAGMEKLKVKEWVDGTSVYY